MKRWLVRVTSFCYSFINRFKGILVEFNLIMCFLMQLIGKLWNHSRLLDGPTTNFSEDHCVGRSRCAPSRSRRRQRWALPTLKCIASYIKFLTWGTFVYIYCLMQYILAYFCMYNTLFLLFTSSLVMMIGSLYCAWISPKFLDDYYSQRQWLLITWLTQPLDLICFLLSLD